MKILIIAVIMLTSGGSIEIVAPSLERCEYWQASISQGAQMEITDEGGVKETVASVECRPTDVNTPDVEGWEL